VRTVVLLLFVAGVSGCLLSCASVDTQDAGRAVAPGADGVRYSLVYVIHGDGDYTYHDSVGVVHRADEEAFSGALLVGERSADAEVFIFHQKPRKRILFFSKDDGEFYYFRRGQPLVTDTYSRDGVDLEGELRLFREHSVGGERTFFLYYGHEVPEVRGGTYDASGTGRQFNVEILSRALEGFGKAAMSPSRRLDFVVLSTCYNGTPCTISRLAPYADYIIASPENLHLSHMRSNLFESLGSLGDLSTFEIARRFGGDSFERLKRETQTAITIVVYDTRKTERFLGGASIQCDSLLSLLHTDNELATMWYYDWGENPDLVQDGLGQGVTVYYRPPQFGRLKGKKEHSGWQAWQVNDRAVQAVGQQ